MFKAVSLLCLVLSLLWVPAAYGQVATTPPGIKRPIDYFEAAKLGWQGDGRYLLVLESAHVRTIPKWLSKGQINNAIADIRYTLDRFPNHPVSLQQLSMVAQMTNNSAVAVSYFERAIGLFPQYALTRAQYGLFLVSINDVNAGIEHLKQAVEMEPKLPAGYSGLAYAYVKKGDIDQAREAAKKPRELGFSGRLPAGL